jgi:hypothetical protein
MHSVCKEGINFMSKLKPPASFLQRDSTRLFRKTAARVLRMPSLSPGTQPADVPYARTVVK